MYIMRQFENTLLFLSGFMFMACSDAAEPAPAGDMLESIRLEADGRYYHAAIDYDSGTAVVRGVEYGTSVTGVAYSLADDATISPDPQSFVGDWPESQIFTVSKGDVSEEYEVILEDYAEDQTVDQVVFGYVQPADWNFSLCIDRLDWTNITHMLLSFAFVNADGSLDTATLDKFIGQMVKKARANGVRPVISIRSRGSFTQAVSTEELRETLSDNIVMYAKKYALDGIDIDYEEYSSVASNLENLQDLFKKIRDKMDDGMILSCAIVAGDWVKYGTRWHTYFDYVNIMSYDHLSGKDKPQQHSSYESYVSDIEYCHDKLAIPYSKIVAGLPFYGYSWDNIPGTDSAFGVTFRSIMDYYRDDYPDAKNIDQIGNTYYNGHDTIRRKCEYARKSRIGGVMIWQLFQDALEPDESLLNVVGDVMSAEGE